VLNVEQGAVATYVHSALRPGLGKIGVLAAVEGPGEIATLEALGRQVGMHVAASRPESLDITGVDPAALEREKAVLSEQARASGKPEAIIEKMVEGRIRKYYEDVVLLEQVWVHDGESRVKAVVQKAGARLVGFARFQLGEGIEKQSGDFAAEVAAVAGLPDTQGDPKPGAPKPA
jgi:elongation factor Ts